MQLVFIGAPGSGKGTQAERLSREFGYKHVSTGDLLRSEVAKATDLGKKIKNVIDAGNLVDDSLVLELLSVNCDLKTAGYIFDGFPRNEDQCRMLTDKILDGAKYRAVYFAIDNSIILDRIINRRVAPKSGQIYNLKTKPPKVDGVCDVSGEKLVHRADDQKEVVENRLKVYEDTAKAMISYYRDEGVLFEIDANRHPDDVFKDLLELIK